MERDVMRELAVPSLEHICTVKIAVSICQQDDVKGLMWKYFEWYSSGRCCRNGQDDFYESVSTLIEKKLNNLPVNEHFIPQLDIAVKGIKSENFNFCQHIFNNSEEYLCSDPDFVKNVIDSCCWTCEGTLDWKYSTYHVFRNAARKEENLQALFELACKCWVEDNVQFIRMKLSKISEDELMSARGDDYCTLYYWLCISNGQEDKFSQYIKNKEEFMLFEDDPKIIDCLNSLKTSINLYMFAWSVFSQSILATEYFFDKLVETERDCLLDVMTVFLNQNYADDVNEEIALFLFKKLNLKEKKEILKNHLFLIIKSTIKCWQFRRYTLDLVKANEDYIDKIIICEIFNCILPYGESCLILLKKIWYIIPDIKKKDFCNFILEGSTGWNLPTRISDIIWENITPKIFDWFLKVDGVKEIYSKNIQKIALKILKYERFDIVTILFEKCSNSDGVLTKQDLLLTKITEILDCFWNLEKINKFLKWALETENLLEKNSVLIFKKKILQYSELPTIFCDELREENWNGIMNFLNNFVTKNDVAKKLVKDLNKLKKKSLRSLFGSIYRGQSLHFKTWNEETFEKHFVAFLSCGTSNEQIAHIMNGITFGVHTWSMCSEWMMSHNWESLQNFMQWCDQYEKVTWRFKNKIMEKFLFGFSIRTIYNFWQKSETCDNINKFLYWGCRKNAITKRKIWNLKQNRKKHAVNIAFHCITDVKELMVFLSWYFEEKSGEEEYTEVLSSFKLEVARMITQKNCRTWEGDPAGMKLIINWNADNAEAKKKIADVKKFLLENYQPALRDKKIRTLIMEF